MIKQMVAVWCNFTDTRCIRRVTGDNPAQALQYARQNGWYINAHDHYCPFHKPKVK